MKQHPRDLFLISIFTTATKPTAPHHPLPATSAISGSDRVSPSVTCVRWLLTVESYKSVPKQRKEIQFPDICNDNYPPLIKSPGLPSLPSSPFSYSSCTRKEWLPYSVWLSVLWLLHKLLCLTVTDGGKPTLRNVHFPL